MKKGDTILVREKQHRYFPDGKFRCHRTGFMIKVKVCNILDDGFHAEQICAGDGKVMTMRYWSNEIVLRNVHPKHADINNSVSGIYQGVCSEEGSSEFNKNKIGVLSFFNGKALIWVREFNLTIKEYNEVCGCNVYYEVFENSITKLE